MAKRVIKLLWWFACKHSGTLLLCLNEIKSNLNWWKSSGWGAQKLTGEKLRVVLAKFSTLS
jgi:hypothetical protein